VSCFPASGDERLGAFLDYGVGQELSIPAVGGVVFIHNFQGRVETRTIVVIWEIDLGA
jgi:hypothetical protein